MSTKAAQEYLREILKRYHDASRKMKHLILHQFCTVCRYHRKYAIRLLNNARRKKKSVHTRRRPGRHKKYDHPMLLEVLESIWRGMNLPCAKRLKAGLALWVARCAWAPMNGPLHEGALGS